MKIILCHNYYRTPGGEDRVFEDERDLLRKHGHDVQTVTRNNDEIIDRQRGRIVQNAIWNSVAFEKLYKLATKLQPDVVHFTNTFPIFSPSAYWAFKSQNVPVVQSLHNYRTICPGSLLSRNDKYCSKCVGKTIQWPGILHGCYRSSRISTAVAAATNTAHRMLGTWDLKVDRYIALSEFSRQRFIEGGLPPRKLVVKPNFVLQEPTYLDSSNSNVAVFVGRLSHEKGIVVLLEAWKRIPPNHRLMIFGSGPQEDIVREALKTQSNIEFHGQVSHKKILAEVSKARVAIVPSLSVETFGRVTIEAYATGTPVIASNIGALAENVVDNQSGWLVPPNQPDALATAIQSVFKESSLARDAGQKAFQLFNERFSADSNYEQLLAIYSSVVERERPLSKRPTQSSDRLSSRIEPMSAPQVSKTTSLTPQPSDPKNDSYHATLPDEILDIANLGVGSITTSDTSLPTVEDKPENSNHWPRKVSLFGLQVSATDYETAVEAIRRAALNHESAAISCHAAHAIVEFTNSAARKEKLNQFEMITPDGQPVRWAMNILHRVGLQDRVYGPELMKRVCAMAAKENLPIFLYGGSIKTLDLLESNLKDEFPDLDISDSISPPFHELDPEEVTDYVNRINASKAKILFVGLGCPKQDLFVFENRDRLNPVQICVGAAFDFHAGQKPIAPAWMQKRGLEWLYRLWCEPRRLFARYAITNSTFLFRFAKQFIFGPRTKPQ